MSPQPLVSVIIATRDREKYITRSLESVLDQTYKNIEVILVDGSPNKKTEEVIKPYLSDPRIHYIHQKEIHTHTVKDRGNIAKARDRGIKISNGKYIACLDDDDFWCNSQKLKRQVQFLEEHHEYVLTGGGIITINEAGQKSGFYLNPETDEEIRKFILFDCPCVTSSVVFRKDAYKLVGGYDIEISEDWDLFLKLGKVGKLYNFQDYFVYYSLDKKRRIFFREFFKSHIGLRRRYRNDYPGYSKAVLLGWLYYFYSFVPYSIQRLLSPIISRLRKVIFGPAAYKHKTAFSKK